MNIVTFQASGDRDRLLFFSPFVPVVRTGSSRPRICGIHMTNAMKERIAQRPSAPFQPNPAEEAIGTLMPDAIAPHRFIETE